MLAAIFVLFVPSFRQSSYRPFRGLLFSFMASSAFYPVICACFMFGYKQMNVEAGANRYLLTIITYLTAVTIYAVCTTDQTDPANKRLTEDKGTNPGEMEAWCIRCLGPVAPKIPRAHGRRADISLLCLRQGLSIYIQPQAVLNRGVAQLSMHYCSLHPKWVSSK